jgi:hypothetical protein
MPSITSNGTVVVRVAAGLYGLAPGNAIYSELVNASYSSGVNGLVNNLYSTDFGSSTTKAVADAIVANLGITGDAATGAANFVEGQLTATAASARGAKVVEMLNLFAGLTADATYGAAATAWNAQVTNAVATAQTSGSSDAAFTTVSTVLIGKAFALTSSADNIVGTALADTISATGANLSDTDTIDGGDGSDTFKITDGASAATYNPTIKNIEAISFAATTDTTVPVVDLSKATGYSSLAYANAALSGTFSNIASASTALNVSAVTVAKTAKFDFTAAAVAGAADTVTINLEGVGSVSSVGSTTRATVDASTAGIEHYVINSNGGATNRAQFTLSADTKTITIKGAAGLSNSTLSGTSTNLTTIDASAATGAITFDTDMVRDLSVTGGSGNDSFAFGGALTASDTIDGGAGTNTVSVDASVAANVNLKNIQTLSLSANSVAVDLSQANLAAITTVSSSSSGTPALTNATPGVHTLSVSGTGGIAYGLKATLDTVADSVTVNLGSGATDGASRGTVTLNYIETANVASLGASAATTANTATIADASTTGNLQTINVTGSRDLSLTSSVNGAELTVNASTATGALTYTLEASTAVTVLGGSGNDAITVAVAELTTDDSVVGGAGNDTMTITNTATTGASAPGRINLSGVENVVLGAQIDTSTASSTAIDLRNASDLQKLTILVTDADGAPSTTPTTTDNTANITVSNIQSQVGTVVLESNGFAYTGDLTLDSDKLTTLNFVNKNVTSTVAGLLGSSSDYAALIVTGDAATVNFTQEGTSTTADYLTVTLPSTTKTYSVNASLRAVNTDTLTGTGLTTLNISGSSAVTIASFAPTTSKLSTVDASASSADVTLTSVLRTNTASVTGGSGNDTISYTLNKEADNTINAGTNSTVSSSSTGDKVIVKGLLTGSTVFDLSSTTDQITTVNGTANAATQVGFENLDASSVSVAGGTLSITGSTGRNNIVGASSNDLIDGGAGNDDISGGDGIDTILGGSGNDTIAGGAGNDIIDADSGDDSITAGAGDDVITGGAGSDTILFGTGSGNDTITLGTSGTVGDGVTDIVKWDFATGASLAVTGNVKTINGFEAVAGTDVIQFAQGLLRGSGGASTTGTAGFMTITAASFEAAADWTAAATDKFIIEINATGNVAVGSGENATAAWAAIANATTADASVTVAKVLFAVDDGTDTFLWYFSSANSTAEAADITLVGILKGVNDVAAGDFEIV